jgi:ParB-like chromosome segregation protein Spo0J
MPTTIALNKIVLDEAIYPRSGVSEFNVGRLISAIKTGVKLPPLIVEASTFRLVDGRHRYEAFKRQEIAKVSVEQKVYSTEADLFADAVRYNIGHGEPLDQYSVRSAIVRLEKYGYSRERISDVVRLPVDALEKIERGLAANESGEPIALKGGLNHMAGSVLNPAQLEVNRHYSGAKASFHARQLGDLLQNDMWPMRSESFAREMDRVVKLWTAIKGSAEAAA